MIIIEIALGIVLAVVILAFLPQILVMGAMAIGIAVVICAIALIVIAVHFDMAGVAVIAGIAGLASVIPLTKWWDARMIAKKVADARKAGGYEK